MTGMALVAQANGEMEGKTCDIGVAAPETVTQPCHHVRVLLCGGGEGAPEHRGTGQPPHVQVERCGLGTPALGQALPGA